MGWGSHIFKSRWADIPQGQTHQEGRGCWQLGPVQKSAGSLVTFGLPMQAGDTGRSLPWGKLEAYVPSQPQISDFNPTVGTPLWQPLLQVNRPTTDGRPSHTKPLLFFTLLWSYTRQVSNLYLCLAYLDSSQKASCLPSCKSGSGFRLRRVSSNIGKAQWSCPGKIKENSFKLEFFPSLLVQGYCQGSCHLPCASFCTSACHPIMFYSEEHNPAVWLSAFSTNLGTDSISCSRAWTNLHFLMSVPL